MSDTATTYARTMPPAYWAEVGGVWVWIEPLNDPLLGRDLYEVRVRRDRRGHAWVEVDGANAGVRIQSVAPDEGELP
jgi:hypothetical protein